MEVLVCNHNGMFFGRLLHLVSLHFSVELEKLFLVYRKHYSFFLSLFGLKISEKTLRIKAAQLVDDDAQSWEQMQMLFLHIESNFFTSLSLSLILCLVKTSCSLQPLVNLPAEFKLSHNTVGSFAQWINGGMNDR